MKFERVLVTGGAGFIGSHLVGSLARSGYKVTVMDNLEAQVHQKRKPSHLNKNAEFILGDVKNKKDWLKALGGVDIIIHMASSVGISQSMYRPVEFLRNNTIGTANLYDILLRKESLRDGIKKIIIPGSKTIYGEGSYKCKNCGTVYPEIRKINQLEKADWEVHCPFCSEYSKPVGIREDKPINPISVYALSKYDTERIALNFGHTLGIPTVVFRGFSVYGPGQSLSNPYSGVCSIFLSRLKNGKPPIIFEDGKQLRDYVYVEDANDFIMKVIEKDVSGVYNLGTGKPTSVTKIAEILKDIIGSDIESKITGHYRAGDNRHDFADISKAKRDLNFRPKWVIKKGLEGLVEWGNTQQAKDFFEKSEKLRKKYFR